MHALRLLVPVLLSLACWHTATADLPPTIAHQGRLVVDGANYTGTGSFKFMIYRSADAREPAIAEATLTGGSVTSITVLHGGLGYTSVPSVTIANPPLGKTATATAVIAQGRVVGITVNDPGSGYGAPPSVEVGLPPAPTVVWANSVYLQFPIGRSTYSEPPAAVSLPVVGGLFLAPLGDSSLANMRALPAAMTIPEGQRAWLRIWFRAPGRSKAEWEELFPHQQLHSVAWALHARQAESAKSLLSGVGTSAGFLVTGAGLNEGVIPASGAGARMMWFSGKRAFRAGEVGGELVDPDGDGISHGRWDTQNVGNHSTAMGFNTVARGSASVALGSGATAIGAGSVAMGTATTARGSNSFAIGALSDANSAYSNALGLGLVADGMHQTVIGRWNQAHASHLFIVGRGTSSNARANAFSVSDAGHTFTSGDATAGRFISAGTSVLSSLTVVNQLSVSQATQLNQLSVSGGAQFSGPVSFNSGLNLSGDLTVRTLTITGGADLAEPFDVVDPSLEAGTVLVIDPVHHGRLAQSARAYDTRVAGVISGAGGIQPGITLQHEGVNAGGGRHVALAGRVYVRADASAAPIFPGDLLTTAHLPGHAMKASDPEAARGAILGKAMSALPAGTGLVLVLVSLQ
jgi:hypothetical protein